MCLPRRSVRVNRATVRNSPSYVEGSNPGGLLTGGPKVAGFSDNVSVLTGGSGVFETRSAAVGDCKP